MARIRGAAALGDDLLLPQGRQRRRPELFARETSPATDDATELAFAKALAQRLNVGERHLVPAYEDMFYYLWRERRLLVNVASRCSTAPSRRCSARALARLRAGAKPAVVGHLLPLEPVSDWNDAPNVSWRSGTWPVRGERFFLVPGDSPMGYRLPLDALPWGPKESRRVLHEVDPLRPRTELQVPWTRRQAEEKAERAERAAAEAAAARAAMTPDAPGVVRTALCTELRKGILNVFLPPLANPQAFVDLAAAIEDTAAAVGVPVRIEGYAPPRDPRIGQFAVTPDPGVIEVNIQPAHSWDELVSNTEILYEEARQTRLGTEKFMTDGRHTGTGGGNHVVMGGATPADSSSLRAAPTCCAASSATSSTTRRCHTQFLGLFLDRLRPGAASTRRARTASTSSRSRSARSTIAARAFYAPVACRSHLPQPADRRHGQYAPHELPASTSCSALSTRRAPSACSSCVRSRCRRTRRMSMAQQPDPARACRTGTRPTRSGLRAGHGALRTGFAPATSAWGQGRVVGDQARDPVRHRPGSSCTASLRRSAASTVVGGIDLQLRQAIEPWHVLGEETTGGGQARYVDSSLERMQLKVNGYTDDRYVVACNGRRVPLHPTGVSGEYVAGVRFRAWQPPSALHPRIGIHAPLVFDVVDKWTRRSVGGCTYHVGHPGGGGRDDHPVNALEAEGRRLARFFPFGHTPGSQPAAFPFEVDSARGFPLTLDLRRG